MTDSIDTLLVARVERLIKALPPAIRSKFLPRAIPTKAGDAPLGKVAPHDLALRVLYPDEAGSKGPAAAAGAASSKSSAPATAVAEKQESIKDKLLRTGGTRLTALSHAVSGESPHDDGKLIEFVLQRVDAVLAQSAKQGETLVQITPGAASGKHWAPTGSLGTNGSAAYSRFKNKYNKLGFTTLVPLYFDERPCKSKEMWLSRKDFNGAVEKAVHRHLSKHQLYKGSEGGSEPGYSNSTHFYVYLAIKCASDEN